MRPASRTCLHQVLSTNNFLFLSFPFLLLPATNQYFFINFLFLSLSCPIYIFPLCIWRTTIPRRRSPSKRKPKNPATMKNETQQPKTTRISPFERKPRNLAVVVKTETHQLTEAFPFSLVKTHQTKTHQLWRPKLFLHRIYRAFSISLARSKFFSLSLSCGCGVRIWDVVIGFWFLRHGYVCGV